MVATEIRDAPVIRFFAGGRSIVYRPRLVDEIVKQEIVFDVVPALGKEAADTGEERPAQREQQDEPEDFARERWLGRGHGR